MSVVATANHSRYVDPSIDDLDLLVAIHRRFKAAEGGPLFRTGTGSLWQTFLDAIPPTLRQQYGCYACRQFVERYGGLATITPQGHVSSALWGELEPTSVFGPAVEALAKAVGKAAITGVFLAKQKTLGTPLTGRWQHFSIELPDGMVFSHPLLKASQAMAAKREDHAMLCRALAELSLDVVRAATHIVETGESLYRGEKVAGVARWLLGLKESLEAEHRHQAIRENLIWRAVATAPPGFCHVRSTMIGTLLEDLAAGLDLEAVKARFAEKMHPLQYLRPTAAPSAGQIQQAEAAVAALEAAGALERRFARVDDIAHYLWRPAIAPAVELPAGGVFSHLRPARKKAPAAIELPETKITWVKFRDQVLPSALQIEYWVTSDNQPFIALVTAANPEAPPILQWDDAHRRNPVSWYVYHDGASPARFNLQPSSWVRVYGICPLPPQWGLEEPRPHWSEGAILLLAGAKDTNTGGMGFFPEQLRNEFHPYRKTIEAYAKSAKVAGGESDDNAAGIDLRKNFGNPGALMVRVTSATGGARYRFDRWD